MTNPLLDPELKRRQGFTSRAGNGQVKQHGDGSKPKPKPPRNAACPCGSGKKAKRCHPDGLQPRVNRVEKGTCQGCGKENVVIMPLRHQGLPGWSVDLCVRSCLRDDALVQRLIEDARKASPSAPAAEQAAGGLPRAVVAVTAQGSATVGFLASCGSHSFPTEQERDAHAATCPPRTATVIIYACERCGQTDLVNIADSTMDAGNLPPRSTPCQPCRVPRLPVAARRATNEEFADLTVAGMVKDAATLEHFLGTKDRLGVLPGVQVASLPFREGDLMFSEAPEAHAHHDHEAPTDRGMP